MKKKIVLGMLVMSVALFGCANNADSNNAATPTEATSDVAQTSDVNENNQAESEQIDADEIIDEAVESLVDYTAFEGSYTDLNYEDASMYVGVNDDQQSVYISVNYGVSYDIVNEWFMDAIYMDNGDGTGILYYTNCNAVTNQYDDAGEVITTEVYTDGSGYFTWDGSGTLLWDGAQEEDLHECLFAKNAEDVDYSDSPAKECVGGFQDSWSGRASCEITANADDSVHISVLWGNGATSTCFWEMDATWVDEDGRGYLSYSNCEKFYLNYADDGTESKEVEYVDGDGFFSVISFDQLAWDGASDDSCMECVFERIG